MYIDASAIVAILGEENDAGDLLARLDSSSSQLLVSPPTVYEAVISLARKKADENGMKGKPVPVHFIETSQSAVAKFLEDFGIKEIMVSADIGRKAVDAAKCYGKVVGHKADLNFRRLLRLCRRQGLSPAPALQGQ
ncbi:ribonuclease VapC [Bradyrhizobium sp. USDA 3240]